jgi:hypothetical protein
MAREVEDQQESLPEVIRNVDSRELTAEALENIVASGFNALVDQSQHFGDLEGTIPVVEDKRQLVDVPFVSLQWRFNPGDYANEFVSATILTRDNKLFILNDGSKGICRQYKELTEKTGEQRGPILHTAGLRVSEYFFNPDDPKEKSKTFKEGWQPAATFYLT